MALAAVLTAMHNDEAKALHPFFVCPAKDRASSLEPTKTAKYDDEAINRVEPELVHPTGEKKKRGRKPGSKKKAPQVSTDQKQPLLDDFANRLREHQNGTVEAVAEPVTSSEVNPIPDLKSSAVDHANGCLTAKGMITNASAKASQQASSISSPQHLSLASELLMHGRPLPDSKDGQSTRLMAVAAHNMPEVSEKAIVNAEADVLARPFPSTPKVMKVTKSGRLMSSPNITAASETGTPKKGRRVKVSRKQRTPSITSIKYGTNRASRNAFGRKIDAIMASDRSRNPGEGRDQVSLEPKGPKKPTHPFFLGKGVADPIVQAKDDPRAAEPTLPSPRSRKTTAVTPGKIRAESRLHHISEPLPTLGIAHRRHRPADSVGLGGASWPRRNAMHVRNPYDSAAIAPSAIKRGPTFKIRKSKGGIRSIPDAEDLIHRLTRQLCGKTQQNSQEPRQVRPCEAVRLPIRSLTTGSSIQQTVRTRVTSSLSHADGIVGARDQAHPAVQSLFDDIKETLTPFDLGKCESQLWTQKYAPQCASHVLQTGPEPAVLRSWLQSLTVSAVWGKHDGVPPVKSSEGIHPRKRRKKAEDEFVVDSDEEDEEDMIDLEQKETEANGAEPSGKASSCRRAHWTRNKNIVLLSGPPGCGKSALVYATAKELGFEVFEINAGSRRCGKDIQDKIGDMTENHLVSRHNQETSESGARGNDDTDNERNENALKQDIASGRQGTMMTFFKSKEPSNLKVKPTKVLKNGMHKESKKKSAIPGLLKSQRRAKSQKQSLILFEEADILFEEDQAFWTQLIKLAYQSKRPMIITCNDENAIPWHQLPLAAILRLQSPAVALVTEYLLVMAAREGHLLDSAAVASAYEMNRYDLRASIAELNFWCQMSVGDRKGGLEWMYQRWPVGQDVDEHGQPIRVASRDTYIDGMGSISHDICTSANTIGYERGEEVCERVWSDWNVSPYHWISSLAPEAIATRESTTPLEELKALDALHENMSAADLYCRVDLPSYEQSHLQPTDPSLPDLRAKDRLNYTVVAPILQIDHYTDFSQLDTKLDVYSQLAIRRCYGERPESSVQADSTESAHYHTILKAVMKNDRKISTGRSTPSWSKVSQAFDLLAYVPDMTLASNTAFNLTASTFDRTLRIIVQDVAPYVRSIVAHELVLEAQRLRLSNLLSEGGRAKRARTTRAARTALEGGNRETKRRERWFDQNLNRTLVMATAGRSWSGMGAATEETDVSTRATESLPGTQEDSHVD